MNLNITKKADLVRQQKKKMEADQQASPSLYRYTTQSVDIPLDSRLSAGYRMQMLEEVMHIMLRESFS